VVFLDDATDVPAEVRVLPARCRPAVVHVTAQLNAQGEVDRDADDEQQHRDHGEQVRVTRRRSDGVGVCSLAGGVVTVGSLLQG
jgi:hypothetical protein